MIIKESFPKFQILKLNLQIKLSPYTNVMNFDTFDRHATNIETKW